MSTLSELGEFALAFATYALVLGISDNALTDRSIALSALMPGEMDDDGVFGRVMTLGIAAGIVLIGAGLAFASGYTAILGLAMPGLCTFGSVRNYSLAVGRHRTALAMDAAWTACVLLLAAGSLTTNLNPFQVFAGWALLPTLIVGATLIGDFSRLSPQWARFGPERRQALLFGAEFTAGAGLAHVSLYLVGLVAGTSIVGQLRAAATILAPGTILIAGIRPLMIPRLAAAANRHPSAEAREALRLVVWCTAPLLAIVIVMMIVPASFGELVLSGNWSFARMLLPWLCLDLIMRPVIFVCYAGHRLHGAGADAVKIRLLIAPMKLLLVFAAAYTKTPSLVAGALALSTVGYAIGWFLSYRRIYRLSS